MAVAVWLVAAAATPLPASPRPGADAIFLNGQVYTPRGWKTAIAVLGGRIAATGSDSEIRRLATKATQITDLNSRTVLPGLFDMHVHPVLEAKGDEGSCRIPQDATANQLLMLVGACVEAKAKGEWVTGAQWQASQLAGTPITAQTLDTVSPDNPIMLFDVSGHSLWVNSRALSIAGIGKDTPNPEGGIIERDAAGNPTGILRETARQMVMSHVPGQAAEATEAGLEKNLDMLLSYGITGFVEAMVFRDDLQTYATLSDKGKLHQRVQACIAYSAAGKINPDLDGTLAERSKYARPNFRPDCIKVFADGVPTESHTAAMLEPYEAGQPNAPPKGLLLFDPASLNRAMARWDRMGLTVLFHAAGDAAVRAALDAIAYTRKTNGMSGPIHQVGHSTFVDAQDLPRFKALNAAVEYSPYLWDPQPINDDITSAVGAERIKRVWPIREGFEANALVVAGSDWAVVPAPDPWIGIETAVTRRNPGGSERSYGLGEAIGVEQAIRMFTINAAMRLGIAKETGSLEAGKSADFIVIDRNPFKIPASEIHAIKVETTYFAGKPVYRRAPTK